MRTGVIELFIFYYSVLHMPLTYVTYAVRYEILRQNHDQKYNDFIFNQMFMHIKTRWC